MKNFLTTINSVQLVAFEMKARLETKKKMYCLSLAVEIFFFYQIRQRTQKEDRKLLIRCLYIYGKYIKLIVVMHYFAD